MWKELKVQGNYEIKTVSWTFWTNKFSAINDAAKKNYIIQYYEYSQSTSRFYEEDKCSLNSAYKVVSNLIFYVIINAAVVIIELMDTLYNTSSGVSAETP